MLATKACIFSFIAFTSMAGHPADEGLPPIDLEHCIAAAQLLVPDILNARPSIEVVDAMMMFVSLPFTEQHPQWAKPLGARWCG
jgi:hypothetical protein